MRIAVDARPLAVPLTGIGRYTRALLEVMLGSDHQWFLYSDRPLKVSLPENGRLLIRHGDTSGGTPLSLLWTQWHYARWAAQDDVDLFWSPRHHLPLRLNPRIASVVTIHDLVWRHYPQTMRRRNLLVERLLMGPSIHRADQVICVSGFTAGELARYYPAAASKRRVIHEAAEAVTSTSALPTGVPERYFLFVGTLEPRKNLPRLLRAFARIAGEPETPALVIVGGGGWGNEDLAGIIADLGIEARVILLENLPEPELQAAYAGAHGLLMPSLYEGFGLPVLEAMRHGVPVVTSSTSALPEIAGDAALLVDPCSEDALSAAMARLVNDPDLHADMSRRSRERAAGFSWQRAAEETLATFESALAMHPSARVSTPVQETRHD